MSTDRARPSAALVMFPGLDDRVIGPAARARLEVAVDLVTPTAFATPDDLTGDLAGHVEVLITGWGCPRLDGVVLDALPALRMVAHAAGTVRPIVSGALWDRGVVVTSAAAANAVPVAEFTFAAIVMVAKDVFAIRDRHRTVRGGRPVVDHARMGTLGRTIGIVGASMIGRLVIERLRTLDVDVVVADPFLGDEEAADLGVRGVDLDELLTEADVVSLHAPLHDGTRHMIGADQLALMRDGAWLLNTARGGLVDTEALTAEVASGRLRTFVDTPDPEPLPVESPLYDLEGAVLTPHIAGSLGSEVARMGNLAVSEVERFVAGQTPLHPVVRADLDRIA
jgi:phosphoglycerate dehydrogenase-like enzyme